MKTCPCLLPFDLFISLIDLRLELFRRAMCIGQRHLRRRQLSDAVISWRVWTRRQAAGAELYAAAGALHKSWAISAGLRALDRVARCVVPPPPASFVRNPHRQHKQFFPFALELKTKEPHAVFFRGEDVLKRTSRSLLEQVPQKVVGLLLAHVRR